MEKSKHFHYAWLIVFSCFMIMSMYMCVVMNCPGLFLISVTEEFGISRSQYMLNTTVISIAMMIITINAGRIYSTFSIRKVMTVAAILLPIAYGMFSKATNIYMFYAISFVVGICMSLCGIVAMSTLITRWFNEKKGLAMGLAFTGSGVGGVVLQPLIGKLIVNVGWRQTYFILAVLMFVTVVPFVAFLIKDYPSDKGLEPLGGIKKTETGEVVSNDGITLKEATKKSYFWFFALLATISSAAASSMVQNISPFVSDLGYPTTVAASLSALSLGVLAIAKVVLGQIYDKKGSLFGTILGLACMALAALSYASAVTTAFLYAGIMFSGLGVAYTTVGYPTNTQDMFGKKDYSAIYGLVATFSSIGIAIGSPITSIIYDATGSYRPAWIMWGSLVTVSVFVFVALYKMARKDRLAKA